MAKGDRKKQQQYSKDADVEQDDSSQNEEGLNRSKKQGRGKHTDRPDSNQDEDSTLVE